MLNKTYQFLCLALSFCLLFGTSPAYSLSSSKLYYHLTFPVVITTQSEYIKLDDNVKDLIISNFIAGTLYAHLLHQHFPNLKFNNEYIIGSLLAQLLQENLQTSDYQSTSEWINPNKNIRDMLLMPGQGGPYQLNDYSKRLENHIGMINFMVLQKSLGYTIQAQDSGGQTRSKGPIALDNKYFGPLAAAYFQYNDMLRLESINKDPWGPSARHFSACMKNLETIPNNMLDMILNATYNAGPWSEINKTYIELCANYLTPSYADKIKHINDYTLTDEAYRRAIATKESAGSTFILYPRQIRFYLDELYLNQENPMLFTIAELKAICSQSLSTLAYVNGAGQYGLIKSSDIYDAFDQTVKELSISSAPLNIGKEQDRATLFQLLEKTLSHLETTLHFSFSETSEVNHF